MNDLRARVYARAAELANIPAEEVGPETSLEGIGLDSSDAVILALEVEELIGKEVDVSTFLRFETLEQAVNELLRVIDADSVSGG